jgi:hypothetical protein
MINAEINELKKKPVQGLRLAVAQLQMRVTFVLGDI